MRLYQITINDCVMLIVGGCEKSRPYPNVGYRFERFDAVFYVFVFDYIHNSATLHNLSPVIFH